MKVRVATIASVCSLLVVGSAAAMVNSVVLRAAAPAPSSAAPPATSAVAAAPASSVVPANAVEVTGSTLSVASSVVAGVPTSVSGSTSSATTLVTTHTGTVAPHNAEGTFSAGSAGTITLSTTGGRFGLVALTSLPGWSVMSRSVTADRVTITFQHDNSYVVFKASLLYGLVNYSVSDYSVPTTTSNAPVTTVRPPVTNPPSTTSTTTTTTLAPFPTPPPCVGVCGDD